MEGFSPVVCWMPSSAQFLVVCSLEWALKGFSPPWHVRAFKEPLRAAGRQACGAEMRKDRLGFQRRSHPVQAAQPMGCGMPGAALAQAFPQYSASHPPWHGPGMAPSPAENGQLCRAFAPQPMGTARASTKGTGYAPMGTFQHCFFFADPLIG